MTAEKNTKKMTKNMTKRKLFKIWISILKMEKKKRKNTMKEEETQYVFVCVLDDVLDEYLYLDIRSS